ncbi:MAG: PorP/SprF family type IX secretion system membrane protein [Bacteroidia bacterium]|nr:PorP/SprF family type IX secretion system membrane protein [Bacteroidia bacterium]
MKRFYIFIFLFVCFFKSVAQDIHFSQFYHTPLLINPSLTGFYEEDMRALINYKDQWRSIASPYKTMAFSYDMPVFRNNWDHGYLGVGLAALNDRVGKFNWGLTQINLSLSSIITLNDKNKISGGFQGGIAQRSINSTELRWDRQFDGQNYNAGIFSGETQSFTSHLFGDLSAGISWCFAKIASNMTSNNHFKAIAGISLYHINKPEQKFYSTETIRLYSKLVLHGGAYIGIKNTNVTLIPSLLFLKQGAAQELNLGGIIRYKLKEESKYTGNIKGAAILIGGHYRVNDALIPLFMLEIANFAIGISYDINTSGLFRVSNGQGGMEISLRFVT